MWASPWLIFFLLPLSQGEGGCPKAWCRRFLLFQRRTVVWAFCHVGAIVSKVSKILHNLVRSHSCPATQPYTAGPEVMVLVHQKESSWKSCSQRTNSGQEGSAVRACPEPFAGDGQYMEELLLCMRVCMQRPLKAVQKVCQHRVWEELIKALNKAGLHEACSPQLPGLPA